MATCSPTLIVLLLLYISGFVQSKPISNLNSPYLSPSTFFPNYQKMLETFKIFIYEPQKTQTFYTSIESLFHDYLLKSPFLTTNGDEAHMFYLSFPTFNYQNTRSISRLIRDLRISLPFWNRTLGADHFYVSCSGIGMESERNLVELKKNSVQIWCFPATEGRFIPHKDVSLPPLNPNSPPLEHLQAPINNSMKYLGYYNVKESPNRETESAFLNEFLNELSRDPEFLVDSEQSDHMTYSEKLSSSRFCLFFYSGEVSEIGQALQFGCVPVVISDRPIFDLPFMDVLKWSEIAVFVGTAGGVRELKRVLNHTRGDNYTQMRDLGKIASRHFFSNSHPEPYDSFHTVLYQLWLRRHTVRYALRDWN